MWVLLLNDMRSSQIQNLQPVFRAETKEALKAFVQSQIVEPYRTQGERVLHHTTDFIAGTTEINKEYTWSKCFKHGGPLEWFNKPMDYAEHEHYIDVGTAETWMEEARINYQNKILSIQTVPQG